MREISRESVTIEWKPPLDDGGLELTKYAIEKHEPDTNKWVKVADVDKDVDTYCIQRLNENCEYLFRVMAQNPIGFSEALESEPIVIKTALGNDHFYSGQLNEILPLMSNDNDINFNHCISNL